MSLNPLKLPKNPFKTNFFLLQFLMVGPSSAMIVVIWEAQTSNLSGRAIWQLSDYLNNRIPFLRIYFSGGVGGVILMSLLFYESRAFWTYLFFFWLFLLGVFDNLRKGRPFSARILDRREYWTSKLSGGGILQLSDDPYHTEFVSWHIEHFSFFFN